jgi:hypothetical protein
MHPRLLDQVERLAARAGYRAAATVIACHNRQHIRLCPIEPERVTYPGDVNIGHGLGRTTDTFERLP